MWFHFFDTPRESFDRWLWKFLSVRKSCNCAQFCKKMKTRITRKKSMFHIYNKLHSSQQSPTQRKSCATRISPQYYTKFPLTRLHRATEATSWTFSLLQTKRSFHFSSRRESAERIICDVSLLLECKFVWYEISTDTCLIVLRANVIAQRGNNETHWNCIAIQTSRTTRKVSCLLFDFLNLSE